MVRRALCVLLAGCTAQHVGVTPREILHHVPELRASGHAVVDVGSNDTYDLSADRAFDVTFGGKHRSVTVRDMIANCPDVPPFAGDKFRPNPPCLLLDTTVESFPLETRHHLELGWVGGILVAVGVMLAITGVASFVCHESADGC